MSSPHLRGFTVPLCKLCKSAKLILGLILKGQSGTANIMDTIFPPYPNTLTDDSLNKFVLMVVFGFYAAARCLSDVHLPMHR